MLLRSLFALHLLTVAAAFGAELPLTVSLSGEPGVYSKAQWKKDWPGCGFEGGIEPGRVTLVNAGKDSALRVNFAPGQIGPEKGGAGWRWPVGRHEGAELSYTLRFGPNFEFVKGGKLPGLCGGPENVSGGRPSDGKNGFSARLMWRREGRGEAYIYHKNQPDKYGHSFPFPEDFRFPINEPVQVRLAVTMNTPGKRDGTLRVWIALPDQAEKMMVEQTDMEWRSSDSYGVDGLYFETFHGGGDKSWAPKKDCWAEFGNLSVRGTKGK
ncbi:hypothetical protein EI77_00816 [Prosthecobacter fusiformis]|uniref:Polysaccharide lyase 14 domain-containing protein n=1 Tax=Prosthecobacter fusiformis TaxID=48464 RepID=A0A4R7SSP4_9BACT|nr:hypothetical protein [Prosthecobacter fusiformis]TDU81506.1 hypothetical protein EI77_00816 [Prosthecobacter fusiformis]